MKQQMKFFKDAKSITKQDKHLLSEYLSRDSKHYQESNENYIKRIKHTKYLIYHLGDIELDEEMYELFLKEFYIYGGRYDVRTTPDTIKGITKILKMYPQLTPNAMEEIWGVYIKDLFEEYSLDEMLETFVTILGENDEAYIAYFDFIERKTIEYQKQFIDDAKKLEELKGKFSDKFISYFQSLIIRKHYKYEDILKYLPDANLVKKDEEQILEISRKTRIYIGCCEPLSYKMLEKLLIDAHLDDYKEKPYYYINDSSMIQATFTKQDFLESIKQEKEKNYKKNRK